MKTTSEDIKLAIQALLAEIADTTEIDERELKRIARAAIRGI